MENREILKRCRLMSGLTPLEVSRRVGMSVKTYYKWEKDVVGYGKLMWVLNEMGVDVKRVNPMLRVRIEGFDVIDFELNEKS